MIEVKTLLVFSLLIPLSDCFLKSLQKLFFRSGGGVLLCFGLLGSTYWLLKENMKMLMLRMFLNPHK